MIRAGCVVDELDAVVGGVGLEGGGGRPGVGAAVVGVFDDGVEGEDVFGGAAEEDEGYGAGGGGLEGSRWVSLRASRGFWVVRGVRVR